MPVDLFVTKPTPVPTPFILPKEMAMNPVMDIDLFIGVPVWAWILVAMGIIFICVWVRWLFRRVKMSSVSGYRDKITSADLESQQVWYFGINKTFSIYCLRLQDRILSFYDYLRKLDKWCYTSIDATGSCGGVSMVMVDGAFDQVKDPIAEVAICTICEETNRKKAYDKNGNPRYFKYIDENGKEQTKHLLIRNHEDYLFFQPLIEQDNPNGVPIDPISLWDPSKIQQFCPAGCQPSFFGARRTKVARELRLRIQDKHWLLKLAPALLAFAVGVVSAIFVYMVVD